MLNQALLKVFGLHTRILPSSMRGWPLDDQTEK
jgi:hypothetical protein